MQSLSSLYDKNGVEILGGGGGLAPSATKTGSNAFTASATTDTVTDSIVTTDTFISLSPTGTQAGSWEWESFNGYFVVTSTQPEAATATYDYAIINDGATGTWGSITGTLSTQTDLNDRLEYILPASQIWNSTTSYVVNDTVIYNSGYYVCVQNHTNHTPNDPEDDWGEYWGIMSILDASPLLYPIEPQIEGEFLRYDKLAFGHMAYFGKINWGELSGTLADQTDLNTALNAKQDTTTSIAQWSNSRIYSEGDLAADINALWYSKMDGNLNHPPPSDGNMENTYWGYPNLYSKSKGTSGQFLMKNGADWHMFDWVTPPNGTFSASAISNTPAGTIAATDVQSALNELDTDKAPTANPAFTGSLAITGESSIPSAPSAGILKMFSKNRAGKMMLNTIGPAGLDTPLQPALFGNNIVLWLPGASTTVAIAFGTTWTARNTTGAQATPARATTNFLTQMARATFSSTTAVNTASGIQSTNTVAVRGNAAGIGGFFFFARFGIETLSGTGQQVAVGLSSTGAALGGEPSTTLANMLGICKDSGETTWQFVSRNNTDTATKYDTTLTVTAGVVLSLYMFCKPNDTKVTVRLVRENDGVVIMDNVEVTATLPVNTTFLLAIAHLRNTGTAINALALNRIYIETDI